MTRRFLSQPLLAALQDTPVVLLHGARQTGKSTLVRNVAETDHPSRYLTLDDAVLLAAAQGDPAGFLGGIEGPVVIDEVQRAPELFVAIKAEVDRNRQPGRFLLTGSANVLLIPRLAESLAGRMEILTLAPFSQGELAGAPEAFIDAVFSKRLPDLPAAPMDSAGLSSMLLAGGYPPAVERANIGRRHAWFGSYVTTVLERDVRDMANIEALRTLPRLLALVAARSASLLNFAELSRSAGIPQSTLKRYFALFEITFLAQLIPPWSTNLGKRLVKTPKVYLLDSGLTAYLMGLDTERLAAEPNLRGPLLETFVAAELGKQASWSRRHPRLYHFRQSTGAEVDFVLEEPSGQLVGVEVKARATVSGSDFNGLRALAEIAGPRFQRGIILYTGSAAAAFGSNLHALPLAALWAASPQKKRH
ncbi:MAG TPA: ATP-binding protein [Bryobacteraceae bacterium]|nr:ATP-binding protein [Bryobacteraceae bacterium]